MKQGIIDLFNSERGILAILLVIAVTVLASIGLMTIEAWIDYTKWIATVLIASKTVTSAIDLMTTKPAAPVPASTPTPPAQ